MTDHELRKLAAEAQPVVFVDSTAATSTFQGLGVVGPAVGGYATFSVIDIGHQPTARYLAAAAKAVPGLLDRLAAADDGEPVMVEWLKGIGFVPGRFPDDLVFGPIVRSVIRNPFSVNNGKEYWMVRTYPIPDEATPTTRGAVRRLLAALSPEVSR